MSCKKKLSGLIFVMLLLASTMVFAQSAEEGYDDMPEVKNQPADYDSVLEVPENGTGSNTVLYDETMLAKRVDETAQAKRLQLTREETRIIVAHVKRVCGLSSVDDSTNKKAPRNKIRNVDLDYVYVVLNAVIRERNVIKTLQKINNDYERFANESVGWEAKINGKDKEAVSEKYGQARRMLAAVQYCEMGFSEYLRRSEYNKIVVNYNRALEYNATYTDVYYLRGVFYQERGQVDLAIDDFGKAIELDPAGIDSYRYRGNLFNRKGQYDAAISDFNKVLEYQPGNFDAYLNRGYAYKMKGNYAQAFSDYNKLVQAYPQNAEVYYARGVAYEKNGQADLALADYGKVIAINPRAYKAYINRGLIYTRKGQYEKAMIEFANAIEINSENPEGYYHKGVAAAALGHNREAVGLWNMYLQYAQAGDNRIDKVKRRIRELGFGHWVNIRKKN